MSPTLDTGVRRAGWVYRMFRWLAHLALDWYYREITVLHADAVPTSGPVLVAVNHPNALTDALAAVTVVPRALRITAKATLFENALLSAIFRRLGIVPLRRASDERGRGPPTDAASAAAALSPAAPKASPLLDPRRNEASFRELTAALGDGAAVLIFPEGRSHSEPALAPLKSGLARIALAAQAAGVRGLAILPLGLTFERKDAPRTRIVAQFAEPLRLDEWSAPTGEGLGDLDAGKALTMEVERRLRSVTLNFASIDDAERARRVARLLAASAGREARPLQSADPSLVEVLDLTRRVDAASGLLRDVDPARRARAQEFLRRLDGFGAVVAEQGIAPSDLWVDVGVWPAMRFVLRESAIAVGAGPLALWGRLNHWLPLRLAGWLGRRTSRGPDEPAMHTLIAGFALVLIFYATQTGIVAALAGPWWAAAYLASLPVSAGWDFRFRDRLHRARQRVRTYLALRRSPALRDELRATAEWLVNEAVALDQSRGS